LAGDLLFKGSQEDRVALAGPKPTSFLELSVRSRFFAAELGGLGIGPDDRVAIIAGNEPAFVIAYLAVLEAGGVAIPLNPASPSHEIAAQLEIVYPSLVVASDAHADLARRASGERPVVLIETELERRDFTPVPRELDDVAVLLFTAGTAGAPKAAMLTHHSLWSNLEQMQSHPGLRLQPDDVALGALPMFHVYGLNVVLGLALFAGASVSLVEHFHPAETIARIKQDGVTVIAGVPAMYAAWLALDDEQAPADAFASVRLCVSGATSLPREVAEGMRARFGVAIHDGYGLTEASPVVTTTAVEKEPRLGSVGPPLPGVQVALVDEDGQAVLEGDPGEIYVKGENVFAGYWDDPVATHDVMAGEWLRTGDIAVADEDGWLTLVDRAKDIIIVSGFNVYPGEVEDALRTHPDVADVAVVGEPHPRTGETVVAYVVAKEGRRPDPVELLRTAGRRLARYKLPTRVDVVDALPRALAGKLVRRALTRPPDATTNPA
jgi:long-chain acyl-CoA synthetase